MYADDLQLYISGHQTEVLSMIEKLNNDFASLFEWAIALGLLLNPNKSQCLAIGTKYMFKKLTLYCHGFGILIIYCISIVTIPR